MSELANPLLGIILGINQAIYQTSATFRICPQEIQLGEALEKPVHAFADVIKIVGQTDKGQMLANGRWSAQRFGML